MRGYGFGWRAERAGGIGTNIEASPLPYPIGRSKEFRILDRKSIPIVPLAKAGRLELSGLRPPLGLVSNHRRRSYSIDGKRGTCIAKDDLFLGLLYS